MNSTNQTQLSQVGDSLNQVLRRDGVNEQEENLNAKVKRTYPRQG